MILDRTHFCIRLADGLIRCHFGSAPGGPTERVIVVDGYHPALVGYLDEIHALPIPKTAADPIVDRYFLLRDGMHRTRILSYDLETKRRVHDEEATVDALDRILDAFPDILKPKLGGPSIGVGQ